MLVTFHSPIIAMIGRNVGRVICDLMHHREHATGLESSDIQERNAAHFLDFVDRRSIEE